MKTKNFLSQSGGKPDVTRRQIRNRLGSVISRLSLGSIVSRFSLVSLICVLMLTLGVGNAWGGSATIKFGTGTGETSSTSGNIDDNLAFSTFKGDENTSPKVYANGMRLYQKKSASKAGGTIRIYVRAGKSCTINSVEVTYSTGKLGYKKSSDTYVGTLSGYTSYNASASPVTIGTIDGTSIHLCNANTGNTQTVVQQIDIEYTCEGEEDECTAGNATSIKAGDVVLIYYPSASKEFGGYSESGDSHWGAAHSYTTTPDGYYPFTVEAGSASGYWSFKNGSTYLAMSEGNTNRLVGSGTKNDASSWSVSFNGSTKEATITNKANSTYLLKYNTNSPRFSSYTSSAGNTALPKIYKYCDDVTYRVTYYGNGNTGGSVPTDNNEYTSAQSATVLGNTNSLVKTGYTWAGWNTQADGNGTTYTAGNTISMSGGSVSLYAKWNQNTTYTVTYNGNGNTGGSVPTDATAYSSGATVTVKGNTGNLAKTGWTFAGWNTNATGTGTNRAAGSTFSITANTTLYAKWTCTVTWSVNGNTSVYSSQTVTYNPTSSKVASVPGPPDPGDYCGQVFAGWTTEPYSGNSAPSVLFKTVEDSPNLNSTGSVTFYAVFADYAN